MNIQFTDEERQILETVRRFSRQDILPNRHRLNEAGKLPDALQRKLEDMGLLRVCFPEAYGGVDGTFTGLVIALKEISYASLIPGWGLFLNFMLAYPLLNYGSDDLKETYLPGLLSLKTTGALAFTEPDTGSDPTQLKTRAERTDGGWMINGAKRFISHSGICDHMILFAKTDDSITAFLVESKRAGYRPGKREAFFHESGLDNGDLYLEDYFAPDNHIIGDVGGGFNILLAAEAYGKIVFTALYTGMAERALDLSLQYANNRTHRGRPIGQKFQMTQVKIARLVAEVSALNAALFHVTAKVDRGEDIFVDAAVLKLMVAEKILNITADAMEIHGAYGLSSEYEVGELYRWAASAPVVMGSSDIQRVIIANIMLQKGAFA